MNELPKVTFPINFKIIERYQWKDPGPMAKTKCATYKRIYFNVGRNNNFKIITWQGKMLLCLKLQLYTFD